MNANIATITVQRTAELPWLSVRYSKAQYPTADAALNAYRQTRKPTVEPTVIYSYDPPGGRFGCWAIEITDHPVDGRDVYEREADEDTREAEL